MEKVYTINTFIEDFCQDIVKDSSVIESLNEEEFSYDVIREDKDTGQMVKYVVDSTGQEIPILDILEMEKADFKAFYPTEAALEIYDQYIDNFKIDYGEDVLLSLRNNLIAQNERIKKYKKISEALNCGF